MEIKSFLAALKDTTAQNMKARASSGESVLKCLDLDVREVVSDFTS